MEENQYTVEFYETVAGDAPVRDFLLALSAKARLKCISYIDLLTERGLSLHASHIKKVEGDVWELRPEFGGTEYRKFFGGIEGRFVLLHAITKKRQKTPRNDIVVSQRRYREWKGRNERKNEL